LGSSEVLKTHEMEARHHTERIRTWIRRANQLPGTVREIDEKDSKKIMFNSYPPKWCPTFIQSGRQCKNTTISDIMQFMFNEKSLADKEAARRRRDQSGGRDSK
jgi:hypothetical protein